MGLQVSDAALTNCSLVLLLKEKKASDMKSFPNKYNIVTQTQLKLCRNETIRYNRVTQHGLLFSFERYYVHRKQNKPKRHNWVTSTIKHSINYLQIFTYFYNETFKTKLYKVHFS